MENVQDDALLALTNVHDTAQTHFFNVCTEKTTTCLRCRAARTIKETNSFVTVDASAVVSRELDIHEATELLDCPTCGRQVHHVRNQLLVQQSLLVRVNQLTSDVHKTNARFTLEPRINPFVLQGIVVHHGTANSRHNNTYARRGDAWFCFDDERVVQVEWQQVEADA